MNGLREKIRNKKGFTLVEMLIVVAIIAILIAVSIPLVGSALEKARDATDQANERAAKAEAVLYYLGTVSDTELANVTPKETGITKYAPGGAFEAYYDAVNGSFVKEATSIAKPYGQCTKKGECYKDAADANEHGIIKVTVASDGKVTITWEAKTASVGGGGGTGGG